MKKTQDDPQGGESALRNSVYRRRELLKLGALGVGVGLPVVMTLVPRQARAEGSWKCVEGNQAGAQGSWSCASRPGWGQDRDWRTRMRENQDQLRHEEGTAPTFAFPGSHEWRMRREEEEEKRRTARGEFNRFGSSDDWR